ncbi:MAG: hypothetical protein IPO40_10975 [Fibrobacteres bacterium]|nr:hypothetical protein [Fibrobacterota bacterium]
MLRKFLRSSAFRATLLLSVLATPVVLYVGYRLVAPCFTCVDGVASLDVSFQTNLAVDSAYLVSGGRAIEETRMQAPDSVVGGRRHFSKSEGMLFGGCGCIKSGPPVRPALRDSLGLVVFVQGRPLRWNRQVWCEETGRAVMEWGDLDPSEFVPLPSAYPLRSLYR